MICIYFKLSHLDWQAASVAALGEVNWVSIASRKYVLPPEVMWFLVPKCIIALGTHPASTILIPGIRILFGGVVSAQFWDKEQ
jgi:hypothetical protein